MKMAEDEEEEAAEEPQTKFTSTSRVRSFFNFEPIDFIDDTVNAVAIYAADAIVSLAAFMKEDKVPDNEINKIKNKLNQRVAEELNRNSELFGLYLIRNIFNIPASIDLAAALTQRGAEDQESTEIQEDVVTGVSPEEMGQVDKEIESLIAQISERHDHYTQLCNSIRKNESEAIFLEELTKRISKIENIVERTNALPFQQLGQIDNMANDCMQLVQSMMQTKDLSATQSVDQHSRDFTFD